MIAIGSPIHTPEGEGRIGLLVQKSASSDLYFLTAKTLLECDVSDVVDADGVGFVTGITSSRDVEWHGYYSISQSIGICRISPSVQVSGSANTGWQYSAHTKAEDVLSKAVCLAHDREKTGIVTAFGAPLHLRRRTTEEFVDYVGAVEAISREPVPLGRDGDAGAGVVLSTGELVGILVGGKAGRFSIAPIDQFWAESDFMPASRAAILTHNRAARNQVVAIRDRSPKSLDWDVFDDFISDVGSTSLYFDRLRAAG